MFAAKIILPRSISEYNNDLRQRQQLWPWEGRSYGGDASKSFNRGSPTSKPEVGKEYEVDITEISRKGDGIARVRGFIVFVGNAKVGKKTRIKVTEVADRFAKATTEF